VKNSVKQIQLCPMEDGRTEMIITWSDKTWEPRKITLHIDDVLVHLIQMTEHP